MITDTFGLITVIVTCYNEEKFIAEAINSVLSQTAISTVREIVVVNDGSTDSSEQVIQKLASEHTKIKYYYQENMGLPSARNTGLNNSTGRYIAFLDGDDLWTETKIEKVVECIAGHPEVGLFYSDFFSYQNDSKKLIPNRIQKYQYNETNLLKKFLLKGGPIVPSSAVVKRECFDKVGLFDPAFRLAQDTDMWLRIAAAFSFQHINEPLVWKRELKKSLGSNTAEKAKYFKMAFDKIESLVPGLGWYRRQRDIVIDYKVGLYYYGKGDWKNARALVLQAINKKKTFLKCYVLLLATFIKPVTNIDILKLSKKG